MRKTCEGTNVLFYTVLFLVVFSTRLVYNTQGELNSEVSTVKLHVNGIKTKWIQGQFIDDENLTVAWDLIVLSDFNLSIANLDTINHNIDQINISIYSIPSLNYSTSVFERWEVKSTSSGLPITLKPNRYCFYNFSLNYSTRDYYREIYIKIEGKWVGSVWVDYHRNEWPEDWKDVVYYQNKTTTTTTTVPFFSICH